MDKRAFKEGMDRLGVVIGVEWSTDQLRLYYEDLQVIEAEMFREGIKALCKRWPRRSGTPTPGDIGEQCVPGSLKTVRTNPGTGRDEIVFIPWDERLSAIERERTRKPVLRIEDKDEPISREKAAALLQELSRELAAKLDMNKPKDKGGTIH